MTDTPTERDDEGAWSQTARPQGGAVGIRVRRRRLGFAAGRRFRGRRLSLAGRHQAARDAGAGDRSPHRADARLVPRRPWRAARDRRRACRPVAAAVHGRRRALALWASTRSRRRPRSRRRLRHPPRRPRSRTSDARPSIAVLPFANMSPDKDQEYFSDGLSEQMLDVLAKVPQLRVIARTSSFSFKGREVDAATIARTLGVSHLLEGSVRRSGNHLRVSAKLVSASDGSQLWSETYDRNLEDVFKVQDEIAEAVVAQLRVRMLGTSMRANQTTDPRSMLITSGPSSCTGRAPGTASHRRARCSSTSLQSTTRTAPDGDCWRKPIRRGPGLVSCPCMPASPRHARQSSVRSISIRPMQRRLPCWQTCHAPTT